jgi:DNA-binding ferritin-like protein
MTAYHQMLADFLVIDVEELEEQMNHSVDELEEFFENFDDLRNAFHDSVETKDPPHAEFQEDLFGSVGNGEDRNTGDNPTFEDSFTNEDPLEKPREQNLFSDKWLRTIFRRTANALHPDKETNEARREKKEGLMTQLIITREENDVFGLLNLYMQYVGSEDLLITHETMEKLCEQLKEQKDELADQKDQILYENPMTAALYEQFHNRSKKRRDKNIERHIQRVQESTQALLEFVASLRNLTVLKRHLEHRHQENRLAMFDDRPFEFSGF